MRDIRQSFISACITNCPRQAYYDYVEHTPHRKSAALILGSAFHATFEYYFKSRLHGSVADLHELSDYYMEQFDGEVAKVSGDVDWRNELPSKPKMDGLDAVHTYYSIASGIPAVIASEREAYIMLDDLGVRVTTHADLLTAQGIIDFKTARVQTSRAGNDYPPDWSERNVYHKPQAHILMIALKQDWFAYHVIGKGKQTLFREFTVEHTQAALNAFVLHTLRPIIKQMLAGIFPAKPSALCSVCPYATDVKRCGLFV